MKVQGHVVIYVVNVPQFQVRGFKLSTDYPQTQSI